MQVLSQKDGSSPKHERPISRYQIANPHLVPNVPTAFLTSTPASPRPTSSETIRGLGVFKSIRTLYPGHLQANQTLQNISFAGGRRVECSPSSTVIRPGRPCSGSTLPRPRAYMVHTRQAAAYNCPFVPRDGLYYPPLAGSFKDDRPSSSTRRKQARED